MHRRLSLLVLAGCGPEPLTGEHVCDDVVVAVAARVAACAGTSDAAEGVPDAFDEVDCLLEEDEDTAIEPWVRGYYDCVGAMSSVPCDLALQFQDDARFWLGQDFHCAQIWGEAGDTGGAP